MEGRRSTLWLLVLLGAAGCSRKSGGDEPKAEVVYVKKEDPAMAAAIAKARASLETFRAVLAAPPAGAESFSVRVAFASGGEREQLWLVEPKLDAGTVTGKLDNEPMDVTTLKLGQTVSAPLQDVSDWKYVEGGVLRGGYTLRVLLDKMSPETRKKMLDEMGFRLE